MPTAESPTTELPVDPKSTPAYRFGLGAVIGLGVLIVIVLVIMVYGVSAGWTHRAAAAPGKQTVTLGLKPGFRILSSDTQPGRLILHVRSDTIDEILVINTDDGAIVARVHGEVPKQ